MMEPSIQGTQGSRASPNSWMMLKTKSVKVNIGLFYLRTWWLQPGFSRAADRGGRGG